KRNRSTPSNFWPSTWAAAVRSSIVSSPIGGSLPSPLPTTPGHAALGSLGNCVALFPQISHKPTTSPSALTQTLDTHLARATRESNTLDRDVSGCTCTHFD